MKTLILILLLVSVAEAQTLVISCDQRGMTLSPSSCDGLFSDVIGNDSFCRAIESVYRLGITAGCAQDDPATPINERQFCPHNAVTREQLALWIMKALEVKCR